MRRRHDNPLSIRNKTFDDPLAVILMAPGRAVFRRRRWRRRALLALSWLLLTGGMVGGGIWTWANLDARVWQVVEERRFVAARKGRASAARPPVEATQPPGALSLPAPAQLIGRISIRRLGVQAMVREGVDEKTLRRAVGHIPGTSLPGQPGNVALAGHRDSFFRGLRDVRRNDLITLSTLERDYRYAVESIRIVGPDDVEVLEATSEPSLTLITCYPFHYVGNAPKRFIVKARSVGGQPSAGRRSG